MICSLLGRQIEIIKTCYLEGYFIGKMVAPLLDGIT